MGIDPGWRLVSIDFEGRSVDIGGVNPWNCEWVPTHGKVTVAHPSYPSQRHTMNTYELTGSDGPVAFAAGEFSNGVWGFFIRS